MAKMDLLKQTALAAAFVIATGSACTASGPVAGGTAWVSLGRLQTSDNDLNRHIVENGDYPKFVSVPNTGGFGAHALIGNRFLVGGEGTFLFRSEAANGAAWSTLRGRYFTGHVGFVAYSTTDLMVYPMVGIGAGALDATLERSTFDEFGDPITYLTDLSNDCAVLDMSLGAEWIFGTLSQGRKMGVVWGLRLGYVHTVSRSAWGTQEDLPDPDLGHVPSPGIDGPYIRITIGWGLMRFAN